jgi:hypothetical protein
MWFVTPPKIVDANPSFILFRHPPINAEVKLLSTQEK